MRRDDDPADVAVVTLAGSITGGFAGAGIVTSVTIADKFESNPFTQTTCTARSYAVLVSSKVVFKVNSVSHVDVTVINVRQSIAVSLSLIKIPYD
jgi:hypothetical protein